MGNPDQTSRQGIEIYLTRGEKTDHLWNHRDSAESSPASNVTCALRNVEKMDEPVKAMFDDRILRWPVLPPDGVDDAQIGHLELPSKVIMSRQSLQKARLGRAHGDDRRRADEIEPSFPGEATRKTYYVFMSVDGADAGDLGFGPSLALTITCTEPGRHINRHHLHLAIPHPRADGGYGVVVFHS